MTEEKVFEEAIEVVEHAIEKAPVKDVGFFLKVISISILIIAIGYAISLVFEGDGLLSYERKDGSVITITKEEPKEEPLIIIAD